MRCSFSLVPTLPLAISFFAHFLSMKYFLISSHFFSSSLYLFLPIFDVNTSFLYSQFHCLSFSLFLIISFLPSMPLSLYFTVSYFMYLHTLHLIFFSSILYIYLSPHLTLHLFVYLLLLFCFF